MECRHQFIKLEELTRRPQGYQDNPGGTTASAGHVWRDEYGARVACAKCGEVRVVWGNGDIIVEYEQNS